MISNERRGTKYPQTGETGENTPFAKQSRKKELNNGHYTGHKITKKFAFEKQ